MTQQNPPEDELRRILESAGVVAVVGASQNPDKASHGVAAYLQRQGYRVVPVNPGGGEILGVEAVASLADVDEDIDVVDVFRPAEETPGIAEEAVAAGAGTLWLQKGITSEDAARIAREAGMAVVMDECMMQAHRRLISAD